MWEVDQERFEVITTALKSKAAGQLEQNEIRHCLRCKTHQNGVKFRYQSVRFRPPTFVSGASTDAMESLCLSKL